MNDKLAMHKYLTPLKILLISHLLLLLEILIEVIAIRQALNIGL